jgi:hypothetical protein
VAVAGRLLPAALGGGATVIAVDPTADPARALPTAIADAGGAYRLILDPGRSYRLFVEPAPGRALARIALGPVTADADVTLPDRRLPAGVAITGTVAIRVEGTAVAGALVQAFCMGASADCKAPATTGTDGLRPVAEAVSGPDGAYRLVVPDPAMVY